MDNATLTTFFRLHVLLPIVVLSVIMTHLFALHMVGTSRPNRTVSDGISSRVRFDSLFVGKDWLNVVVLYVTVALFLLVPFVTSDPDNYVPADNIQSPLHIQPEWYFLWLYAILRSLPDKLGGVVYVLLVVVTL